MKDYCFIFWRKAFTILMHHCFTINHKTYTSKTQFDESTSDIISAIEALGFVDFGFWTSYLHWQLDFLWHWTLAIIEIIECNKRRKSLLGQAGWLQCTFWTLTPWQLCPPLAGSGWLHNRDLDIPPLPQDLEHWVKLVHWPQPPFTFKKTFF